MRFLILFFGVYTSAFAYGNDLTTEANQEEALHRDVRPDTDTIYRSPVTKTYALSVRCLKNN